MPTESLLTRAKIEAVSLATGVSTFMDAPVSDTDFVTVQADMTGAANGDLTITVVPFEADGNTLSGVALPPASGIGAGPTFASGRVTALLQYNVQGIDKVRITFKNNNAGTQTLTRASWRTATW
jgi:hypothetical protein